jgi:hypothetical protein
MQQKFDQFKAMRNQRVALCLVVGLTGHMVGIIFLKDASGYIYVFYLDSTNHPVLDTTDYQAIVNLRNDERAALGMEPMDKFFTKMKKEFCQDIYIFIETMCRILSEPFTVQSYMITRELRTIMDSWEQHINSDLLQCISL